MNEPASGAPRLRGDLPFQRIAVVLSGGGALGAYEVGVLRTLQDVGLRPHIVAGASAGALNAVAWVAQGFRTDALEDVWRRIHHGAVGMRWSSLGWRAAGGLLVAMGLVEMLLTWSGSAELGASARFWSHLAPRAGLPSSVLDLIAWGAVMALGAAMLRTAGRADVLLGWLGAPPMAGRVRTAAAIGLALWTIAHVTAWVTGLPWPHRFSAMLLLVAFGVWVIEHPGRAGRWARRLVSQLLPESSRPGLWGGAARRSLVARMMADADEQLLIGDDPHVIIVALALDTGRVAHFVNGADPAPGFRASVEANLGEVITLHLPEEMLTAAVASSAIPLVFEPVTVGGRQFVDPVTFATHPLRAAVDAGADAVVVVRVAPSENPPPVKPFRHPVDAWGRFLDLSGWRDLQQELRAMPLEWTGAQSPRALCLVEPDEALPWGVLAYSPRVSNDLIARGRTDALRALERAGWVEPSGGQSGA